MRNFLHTRFLKKCTPVRVSVHSPHETTMKFTCLILTTLCLSACATNKPAPVSETPNMETSAAIKAFEDVCLKTAPSFSGAAQAAGNFGITEITDAGFMKMGFNKDQSLGVQIKANKECVITTPPQRNNALTSQFLQLIGRYSTEHPSNRVPTKASIKGVPFIFQHDREGGEAFVMLRANG